MGGMYSMRRAYMRRRGGGPSDVTAPTLSSPTDTASGATTADLGVTTDEGNGTLYWVVSTSATPPSAAQVKAGNDHTGSAAADSGSQAVSGTGVQSIAGGATGLTAFTAYYAHFMHEDAAANQSSVASADGFTTYISDLGQLDNLYGIYSLKRVRAAYGSGNLVRLRRVSDDVEADYAAGSDGWIDGDAITTWLGGSSAMIVTVYDQSGNSRDFTQSTAGEQPALDLSGSYPRMVVTATGEWLDATATAAGWARNIGAVTAAAVRINDSTAGTQSTLWCSDGAGVNGFRATLQLASGNYDARSKAIDGGSAVFFGGPAADTVTWTMHLCVYDFAAGVNTMRVNAAESTTSFTPVALTSDTDSLAVHWGTRNGGNIAIMKTTALFLFRDALTAAERGALNGFCEDLKAA